MLVAASPEPSARWLHEGNRRQLEARHPAWRSIHAGGAVQPVAPFQVQARANAARSKSKSKSESESMSKGQ